MKAIFTVVVRETIEPQLDAFISRVFRRIRPYCQDTLLALRIDDNGVETHGGIEVGAIRSFYFNDMIFMTPRFLENFLTKHKDPNEIVSIVGGELMVYAQINETNIVDDIEAELETNFTVVGQTEILRD